MGYFQGQYYSHAMESVIEIGVIVPTLEHREPIYTEEADKLYPYKEGLPVLYLLHGAFGNYSSWTRNSNIERYAAEYKCIVVMVSAENSFYQDMYKGKRFKELFTKELPWYISRIFPASTKREDTYIAGLSMGGYGSWYLALSEPDIYCKAASLSGALNIQEIYESVTSGMFNGSFHWDAIFEDCTHLSGSKSDLITLLKQCVDKKNLPELYMACGTEDMLYRMNTAFRDEASSIYPELIYEEGPGEHEWDFWDEYIQKVLKWMFD